MPIQRRRFVAAAGGGTLAALSGCARLSAEPADPSPGVGGETLTLTSTTSPYDTGLLDALNGPFENRYGAAVDAIARGTGAALETARHGDADVAMVHARALEDEFMRQGYGINRRDLMFNDFVVVGPRDDPAGVQGSESVPAAFSRIASAEAPFVSRGDNSGTHARERTIWERADVVPDGSWYRETGQGMGQVLNVADEGDAYTLSDRGTYLSRRSETDLVVLVQGPLDGGPALLANPYGILAANPAVNPGVNYDLAMAYIGYVTSPHGQAVISNYEADGEQLFFPSALSADPRFQQYVPAGWSADSTERGT